MKLNVLLAKTDSLATQFKGMVVDFAKFFKNKQGAFVGEKKTYQPKEGTIDEPTKRGNTLVQTTVDEKFKWFKENSKEYIDALFAQEATNASGAATAELVIDGKSWGVYTSLELLRLKSVVENNNLHVMLNEIPVRSDSEEWDESENEMYAERSGIYEIKMEESVIKSTVKEDYILKDPNVSETSPNYSPVVSQKTSTIELGDYTRQKFSGEWSQRQKASALKRRSTMITSIVQALKTCNEVEAVESELNSDRIFSYLFEGEA